MRIINCIVLLLVVTGTAVWAQPVDKKQSPAAAAVGSKQRLPGSLEPGQPGPFERYLFPPELIMQHQNAIGLTSEQQTALREEMQKMMAQFTDLQWQQSAETEALTALVAKEKPDEKEVLTQLDKLLNIENQIKRLQTRMLVRIKNQLTPEQQAQLRSLGKTGGPQPKAAR
jgi:Spy/CpxP family protein refolding chaperone